MTWRSPLVPVGRWTMVVGLPFFGYSLAFRGPEALGVFGAICLVVGGLASLIGEAATWAQTDIDRRTAR